MSYLREFPKATLQDFLYFCGWAEPDHVLHAFRHAMRDPSQLTHADRELIGAYCLALNNSQQCHNVHARCYQLLGGEPWKVHDLVKDSEHTCVEEKYRPLFNLVRKSTLKADSVCKKDIGACYDAGWNGDTINRVNWLTGAFNMMARWYNSSGMKYTAEEIVASSDGLTFYGYNGEGAGLNDEDYRKEIKYDGIVGKDVASEKLRRK